MMNDTDKLQHWFRRSFGGLWLSESFRRLWLSLTVTSFGAQITNLALPLTAALLLNATPMQMGILVALETLPFALFSLHAGVLLDRVRKLPVIIAADIGRGIALLAMPSGSCAACRTSSAAPPTRCCWRRWPAASAWSRLMPR
jgi:MFS family permease